MILTEIGEIGVEWGGRRIVLRPSLHAMTRIGQPAEIVQVYASVMSDDDHPSQRMDALVVLNACCDDDLTDLFGFYIDGLDGLEYIPGAAPDDDLLPLARCLLKHGVVGALPTEKKIRKDEDYIAEFDARAHVSLAIAHLGASSTEAWQMTMTELVGALRAKFPQKESKEPGANAPSPEELDETMEWFDKIEAIRKQRSGAH